MHVRTPHSELQSFRSADLNSVRALPRGPRRPLGCPCATCWCWRFHTPARLPRHSHILWFHVWHQPASLSSQDISEVEWTTCQGQCGCVWLRPHSCRNTHTSHSHQRKWRQSHRMLRSGSRKGLLFTTKKLRHLHAVSSSTWHFSKPSLPTTQSSANHLLPRNWVETFSIFPTGGNRRPCNPEDCVRWEEWVLS